MNVTDIKRAVDYYAHQTRNIWMAASATGLKVRAGHKENVYPIQKRAVRLVSAEMAIHGMIYSIHVYLYIFMLCFIYGLYSWCLYLFVLALYIKGLFVFGAKRKIICCEKLQNDVSLFVFFVYISPSFVYLYMFVSLLWASMARWSVILILASSVLLSPLYIHTFTYINITALACMEWTHLCIWSII